MFKTIAIILIASIVTITSASTVASQQIPTQEETAKISLIMANVAPRVTFCSAYGRIVLEHTKMVTDKKTRDNFYLIEKDAAASLTKFVQIHKIPPHIEMGMMIKSMFQNAVTQFNEEAALGKGPEMVTNTLMNCYMTLLSARVNFGVGKYFSSPPMMIEKPVIDSTVEISPLEKEAETFNGMRTSERGVLFFNISDQKDI